MVWYVHFPWGRKAFLVTARRTDPRSQNSMTTTMTDSCPCRAGLKASAPEAIRDRPANLQMHWDMCLSAAAGFTVVRLSVVAGSEAGAGSLKRGLLASTATGP